MRYAYVRMRRNAGQPNSEERLEDAEITAQDATHEMAIGLAEAQSAAAALPVAAGDLQLRYKTGWSPAYIHFKLDGGEWTEPPGVLMQESAADGTEVAFSIQGRTLEFVLTDGQGNWDKPSPTQNYVIDEPGAFVLSKGAVVPEEES